MKKRFFSLGRMLVLGLAMLAVPLVVSAARLPGPPPTAPANPLYPPGIGWNPVVDYTLPNFAQSPNIRKFVNTLPGLGVANANNLGQYIPVAVPDTTTFPGDATSSAANPASDYYEIEVGEYFQQMHSDLPASGTQLRGFAQINGPAGAPNGIRKYLGAAIIAKSYDPSKPAGLNGNGKPVRIKFHNNLPANSLLPLPMDTTIMGAGMGPLGGTTLYSQNRVAIHLHGGATPWISDGTPHQWITPAGETTPATYRKGVSIQNVPDMMTGSVVNGVAVPCKGACYTPAANDGVSTYYYTNQQSGRLMFYHDHAFGITRLNVYAGIAGPYLLIDQYEEDMIAGTNVYGVNPTNAKILPDQSALSPYYRYGIPLVIQDKTFVNDATTGTNVAGSPASLAWLALPNDPQTLAPYAHTDLTLNTDPLWAYYAGTTGGNLWMGHEYMPVENPFDPSGSTPNGRWDYAPFMIPPMLPLNVTLPSPTTIPESFSDVMVVNGTAFPYVTLPPDALRFRILNACNDRSVNLQLYYAQDRVTGAICKAPNTFTPANCTEVSMVPANANGNYPTWPIDGRDGGVPDPVNAGPPWIQIGTEGGFLPKVALVPTQPIDYETSRQNLPIAGLTMHSLLLLPAVRADVIVDLSPFSSGDVLMVYNDAPAAMPNYWAINDYYTDDPDQTGVGGAPTTPPGFGPNTRTVMQIRIAGTKTSSFNFHSDAKPGFIRGAATSGVMPAVETPLTDGPSLTALKTALPKVFAASQPPPIVPQLVYNDAYPSGPHHFAGAIDNLVAGYQTTLNISGAPKSIAKVTTVVPGNNYPTPPTVVFVGNGTGAAAKAGLNPIGGITLLTTGTGYTSVPTVTIGLPALPLTTPALFNGLTNGVRATAVATISGGGVNAISPVELGAGYTNIVTPPTCTITGGGGTGATCEVLLPTLNTVGSIVLTNAGSGYTREPMIFLVPTTPGGLGAAADSMLVGDLAMTGKNMTEGFDPEYGRMFIELGSTPNPLTPGVGAGFAIGIARYIDPPTEIMNDGETIIWRLSHLGVDSHAMHFHLFNLQVVSRVDWANVMKNPYPDEIGWKETIRTNPIEDVILAIRPTSQVLPFPIPNSNRVLDPTTPLNSTTNFFPVAPPPGTPAVAQQSNVMTNFGWEYVWHCHLLGHEENDMMRPMVLVVATAVPFDPILAVPTTTTGQVVLNWTINAAATNTTNAPIGFKVYRATGAASTAFTLIATINDNSVLTYTDTTVAPSTTYRYIVLAFNYVSNSPGATIRNVTTGAWTVPTVTIVTPANGATFTAPATIQLTATVTPVGSTVEYFAGSVLLGSATVSPYTFNFANLNPGTYSLTAKVLSLAGATVVSAPVVAFVTTPAPTVISPSGSGTATTATFNLNALSGATGYTIWLQDFTAGTGGPLSFTAAQGGAACATGNGVCSFTTPLTSNHSYGWGAAGNSAGGQGPWSSILNFFTGIAPVAPLITAPTGGGITSPATFTLTAVPGATGYVIWLQDFTGLTGGPISLTVAQGGASCATAGGACNFSIPVTVGHAYAWAASALNAGGQGPWSSALNFFAGALPVAPVTSVPTGPGIASPATFTMTAVSGATDYVIWLQDNTALTGAPHIFTVAQGGAACATTGPCDFSLPLLSTHSYSWAAAAQNGGGTGPYSGILNFTAL